MLDDAIITCIDNDLNVIANLLVQKFIDNDFPPTVTVSEVGKP